VTPEVLECALWRDRRLDFPPQDHSILLGGTAHRALRVGGTIRGRSSSRRKVDGFDRTDRQHHRGS
jgi:hypothetical protein